MPSSLRTSAPEGIVSGLRPLLSGPHWLVCWHDARSHVSCGGAVPPAGKVRDAGSDGGARELRRGE